MSRGKSLKVLQLLDNGDSDGEVSHLIDMDDIDDSGSEDGSNDSDDSDYDTDTDSEEYYYEDDDSVDEKAEVNASDILSSICDQSKMNKIDDEDADDDCDDDNFDSEKRIPELTPMTDSVKAFLVDGDLISRDEDDANATVRALSGYSVVETSDI